MNKKFVFALLPILAVTIGCGPTSAPTDAPTETPTSNSTTNNPTSTPTSEPIISPTTTPQEDIKLNEKTVNYYKTSVAGEMLTEEISLYFEDLGEIPYIDIELATEILNFSYNSVMYQTDLKIYDYKIEDGKGYITQKYLNSTCVLDAKNNTMYFEDLSSFASNIYNVAHGTNPIYGESNKYISANPEVTGKETVYKAGNSITIDFNDYNVVKIVESDGNYYIPLGVVNAMFLATGSYATLTYNFKDVYLLTFAQSAEIGNPSAKIVRQFVDDSTYKTKFSDEFTKYNYDCLLLTFEYNWGNQARFGEIDDFDAYLEEKRLKNNLLSGKPELMDAATEKLTSYYLSDGHTTYVTNSPFVNPADIVEKTYLSDFDTEMITAMQKYSAERRKQFGTTNSQFKTIDNTVFLSFNSFDEAKNVDLTPPYDSTYISKSTVEKFAYLYQFLEQNEGYENVVIDLSYNTGGSTESLFFIASLLIGDFTAIASDPITGAISEQPMLSDINADGVFDDKDVSLADKGYNIALLTSRVSFSCGNYYPNLVKNANENVKILGQTSGGGTCAIYSSLTPMNSVIALSGRIQLTVKEDGNYHHVENGAPVDYELTIAETCDYEFITEKLNTEVFVK